MATVTVTVTTVDGGVVVTALNSRVWRGLLLGSPHQRSSAGGASESPRCRFVFGNQPTTSRDCLICAWRVASSSSAAGQMATVYRPAGFPPPSHLPPHRERMPQLVGVWEWLWDRLALGFGGHKPDHAFSITLPFLFYYHAFSISQRPSPDDPRTETSRMPTHARPSLTALNSA